MTSLTALLSKWPLIRQIRRRADGTGLEAMSDKTRAMRATAAPDPFPYYTGSANQQEEGMRITSWIVTLLAAAVLSALAQEETLKDIEHGAKKAGEKMKDIGK